MSNYIGIEFDNDEVTVAQIHKGKAVIANARLPQNLIRNYRIVSPETMAQELKKLIKDHKFSGKNCVMIVPPNAAYFRDINMPVMTDAQLKLNLPYEFKDFVGLNSANYIYDYAVGKIHNGEDGKPESMDIYAAAADQKIIQEYADVVESAGLKLKAAIPREMAIVNILRSNPEILKTKDVCLLNMGFDDFHISILSSEKIEAEKVVEMGMKDIDKIISDKYGIDEFLAASYRDTNFENVLDIPECRSVYESIALEVMKTVNFYKYENPEKELNCIIFCGSGAADSNMIQTVLSYISFSSIDVAEILPQPCREDPAAKLSVLAIGATL